MGNNSPRFTLYMTSAQHKELKVICALNQRTMSEFVNEAIKEKVEKLMCDETYNSDICKGQ